MPSAEFCPITTGVVARRAARFTLGTGGRSTSFGEVLSWAPLAWIFAKGKGTQKKSI